MAKGVALDGKTLRGSRDGEKAGIIAAQQPVDCKTNEITQVQPLIAELDLQDAVVSADALLTQKDLARHLVEQKGAEYLFTAGGEPADPAGRPEADGV